MQLFSFKTQKVYFFLLIGLVFFGPLAITSFAAESRIGFVDIQKAVLGTKARENRIKKMLEDLSKQSFVLDPELKKKKEDRYRKEKIAFERYLQDQNNEFSKNEKEITQKILIKMMKVIKTLGKEKKYTMILEEKVVLYHDRGNDLTALATKTYDRSNK